MTVCMKIVHKKNRTSEKIGFTCHAVGTERARKVVYNALWGLGPSGDHC